jgi:hypothetical protein
MADKPEARPDIGKLCAELESLSDSLRLDQRQEDAWRAIQQTVRRDIHSAWIPKVLRENRSTLVPLAARGFSQDHFDRCRSIADFLNKTAETCPTKPRFKHLEAMLKGDEARAMAFTQALRHDRSHGDDAKFVHTRELVAEFKAFPQTQQRHVIEMAARRVSKACKFQSLDGLVALLLDGNG